MAGIALIVGANGVLGSELSRQLAHDYYTIGTSRKGATSCSQTIYVKDLSAESCDDICKQVKEISLKLNKSVDIVIYNAGFGYSEEQLTEDIVREMFQVNVYGAKYIATEFPATKFVYVSSCAVLGTTGTEGLETYSNTKRKAEHLLRTICKNLSVVRPTIVGDTEFAKRAKIKTFSSKGFMNASEVAKYVVFNLHKECIKPGWQAKILHIFQRISPKLAQSFLKA